MTPIIGKEITIKMDRPLGSYHPEYPDLFYPINYGYVEDIIAADGEEQDVYLLGVEQAVDSYSKAIVIAIVKRQDDVEEKWVAAPKGMTFSLAEIEAAIQFQERYFDSEILLEDEVE